MSEAAEGFVLLSSVLDGGEGALAGRTFLCSHLHLELGILFIGLLLLLLYHNQDF